MARRSQADDLALLERSQAVARSGITNALLDQADAAVDRAVAAHVNGKLTDRDAAVVIAMVAELRSAARQAQHAFLKGIEAGEHLTTNGASA